MAHRVVVTAKAEGDLRSIHRYISSADRIAADRYRQQLIDQIELVANFSRAGRRVPEVGRNDIRELIRSPYRIIYRINEREQTVQVLRFWHAARGTPKI